VEAAFPHLPEAKISGFLFELRLPLGRNHLTFQVFDHEHIWRTFYTATIFITTRGCVSGRRIIESVSFRTSFVSYRHYQTSMLNTTNLFEIELVQHFIDRFGDLLGRYEPRSTVFGGAAGQDSCGALLNAAAFVNLLDGEEPASLAPLDR
jgi:hypothetical protein